MNRTGTITLIVITASMMFMALPSSASAAPLGLNWAAKAAVPYANGQAAVITGGDGRIYLMGGFNASNTVVTTAKAYNPSTNTWSDLAPLPTATRGAAVALAKNGLIYVIGGYANGYVNANQAYNVTSNTWSTKTVIPTAVWEAGAATGNDGRIYVFGGENGLSLVQVYNPATDTWSSGAPLPTPRDHLRAVKSNAGLIYAIGGFNGSAVSVVSEYDPAANTWRNVSPMPRAKNSFGATLGPDGLIYTFGGSTTNPNDFAPYLGTVEAYDTVANQWFTVGALAVPRRELSAATAPNRKMYVLGGGNGTYLANNDEASVAFPDQAPVATINRISPSPVTQGQAITFNGTGTDSDGSIIAYRWRSSLSGDIGNTATFTTTSLPVGTQTIYFSVEDNAGLWSTETQAVVTVSAPISGDPVYQAVQTTMLIMYVTLAAAIAAVIISAYNLMSRRKTGPAPATP